MATRAFNDLIDLLETRPETVSEYLLEQKRLKSSEPQVYKAMAKRGIIELDENGEPKEWKMGNGKYSCLLVGAEETYEKRVWRRLEISS